MAVCSPKKVQAVCFAFVSFVSIIFIALFISLFLSDYKGKILDTVEFSRSYSDRKGELLQVFLTSDDKYRIYRPIEEFPPQFIEAILLQEDKFFYSHKGINFFSIFKAGIETYIKRSRRIGASTITMQVAKLKFHLYTKSISGKLNQIFRAIMLELCYSKNEILDAYLNLAPCGGNVEGFESGAWYYFNKSAKNLNLSENIMLCVLPQNPSKRTPTPSHTPSELIQARKILFESWAEKHPEDAEFEVFMDMQISCECHYPNEARHFTEMLVSQNFENERKGTVKTSLNLETQHKIEELFDTYLNQNRHFGVKNGAVLLVDWKSMEVIANIGSADYYKDSIDGQVNITTSRRSPGSTLKPFIYALALDQGKIHYSTMLKDTPQTFNEYTPDNYGSVFKGPVKAWFALSDSRNIPAITLNREIKENDLYDFMKVSEISGMKEKDYYGLSIVLGSCEVSMLDLVKMYGTLANNGLQYDLNFAPEIRRGRCKRLLSKESAFIVRKMLEANTPPYETKPQSIKNIPVAYKTGTSIGFKDCWSVGIFDRYICAVWIGNANGEGNNSFIGRLMAAPLLFNIAYSMLSDIPENQRLKPEMNPEGCKQVEVCAVSGALPNENCVSKEWAWFIPGISPIEKCKIHRKINVDTRTGYRTDQTPEENKFVKSVTREFWPSDLQQLFEQARLPRLLPPDYPPDDFKMDYKKAGYPPEILSPMTGTDYIFRLNDRSKNKLMLCASADADTRELLWFEGCNFIGRTSPGQSMEWNPEPGKYELTVTDQKGRSDTVWVSIKGTEY